MEGASYECMICMDLLIEPVTIQCGHTFCKLCLAGCITSLHKCPICRKPIYQLIDNISKNFLLESLIKEKYPERYNQRLKALQPQLGKFNEDTVTMNNSIPSLILPNSIIPPQTSKTVFVQALQNQIQVDTIQISSINDKIITVIPTNEVIIAQNIMCSMCEIVDIKRTNDNRLVLTLKGIKRVTLLDFYNHLDEDSQKTIALSNSKTIVDVTIDSEQIKEEILNTLHDIENLHKCFLQKAPYRITNKVNETFGKPPTIPSNINGFNKKGIEGASFYYLAILKNEEKINYYHKTNVVERVKWIHGQYTKMMAHLDNISLVLLFYDIDCGIKGDTSWTFLICLIALAIILGFLAKFRIFIEKY